MIRAPDEYRRETLAGPHSVGHTFGRVDHEELQLLEETLEESRRLYERRQQRMAEMAPLLSKLKRIGFYDNLVKKQYENILLWCEAYYEDGTHSIEVSFDELSTIRWTLDQQAALDKIKACIKL
jgi:hypothetical protein